MIHALLERKAPLLLFFILFILLVLLSTQAKSPAGSSLLESILFRLVTPAARVAGTMDEGVTGWVEGWVDLRLARVENLQLKERLSSLEVERHRWQAERVEYERLLGLLALKETVQRPSVAARVVSRGQGLGAHTLILSRGGRDGIVPGLPVIVPSGVAGKVLEAGPLTSKVQLALDPNSSVAALSERTRAQGMINGRGGATLRMEYVADLEDVQPGDRVVTSGLDRIFPPGLAIGTVLQAERGEGLVQTIDVEPAVEFDKLEEVLVLLPAPAEGS